MKSFHPFLVGCMVGFSMAFCAFAQESPPSPEQTVTEPQTARTPRRQGWRYIYQGRPVYYVQASSLCCDQMSMLYDAEGNLICMPDGGYTGRGDGRCADFSPFRAPRVRVYPMTPASL